MSETQRIERAIRRIRQRIFGFDEQRQIRATEAIKRLKARLPVRQPNYHPFYAAE